MGQFGDSEGGQAGTRCDSAFQNHRGSEEAGGPETVAFTETGGIERSLDLGEIFGIENSQFGSRRQSEGFQMDPDAPGVFRLQAGTPHPGAIGQGSPRSFGAEYPDRIRQQAANAHTGSTLGVLLKPRGIFGTHHGEVGRSESESDLRGQSLQGAHRQGLWSGRRSGGADPRWKFYCENGEGQAHTGQPTYL